MPPEWGVTLPHIEICSEDADCGGCGRCRDGMCDLDQTWDSCMCHDECARAGLRSCDRSSQKPSCPGVCSGASPTRPMACGRGDDTVRIAPFTGRRCLVQGAAVTSAQAIVAWPSAPARPARSCRVACGGVEVVGTASELVMPGGDRVQQVAMTFANGRWYVAWSGQRAHATLVQRFSPDGRIEGPALRIEGMGAGAFAETGGVGGEIVLIGWVSPAYSPEGPRAVVHRLTPELEAVGVPLLLRGPGAVAFATSVVREDGGDLVSTGAQARKGTLVREVRLPADARGDRSLASRDWWPAVEPWGAFERVDGQPYLLDGSQGALQIRALQDSGFVGPPRSVFPIPAHEGRQTLLTRRIGVRWYVGANAARSAPIVRVSAVDASSLAPVGPLIELLWSSGSPHALIDANGTAMLLGSVESGDRSFRPSLVPLDFVSGASCSASTLSVPSLIESYQAVRAIHFEGARGAAVIAAWGTGDLGPRAFFTPLRCARLP